MVDYVSQLPHEQQPAIRELHETIIQNLPSGFEVQMQHGMISYVVPHDIYPEGYHCNPNEALPFISLAVRKNYVALYHMGLYVNEPLLNWFVNEYRKRSITKLDMGKSCLRFKKVELIPNKLIGELCQKITPAEWIKLYENGIKNK